MHERLTRDQKRQQTRDELIDSAVQLFAKDGVSATSVENVAESAGYSRGAYHSNFRTRDELLDAVVARVVDDLGPRLAATLAAGGGALDRLSAYIARFVEFCAAEPIKTQALVVVVAHRATTTVETRAETYDDRVAASLSDLTALFKDGQQTGEMRPFDPVLMAALLRRALDAEALRVAHGAPPDHIIRELTATFTRATRADHPRN